MADLDAFLSEINELEEKVKKGDIDPSEEVTVAPATTATTDKPASTGASKPAASAVASKAASPGTSAARKRPGAEVASNPRPGKKKRTAATSTGAAATGAGVVAVMRAPQHRLTVKDPLAPKPAPVAPQQYGATMYGMMNQQRPGMMYQPPPETQDPFMQQQSAYEYNPYAYERAKQQESEGSHNQSRTAVGGERKMSAAAMAVARATGKLPKKVNKHKFVRSAAGAVWHDKSLQQWPENDFRLFIGDVGNECSEELLSKAFSHYKSFAMCKVIKDKDSKKNRGYAFVSLLDPDDASRAIQEMNGAWRLKHGCVCVLVGLCVVSPKVRAPVQTPGKYVGNRPIKVRRSTWNNREISNVRVPGCDVLSTTQRLLSVFSQLTPTCCCWRPDESTKQVIPEAPEKTATPGTTRVLRRAVKKNARSTTLFLHVGVRRVVLGGRG